MSRHRESQRPPLGTCPECGRQIPAGNLLIKYESPGGWPRMFAECPNCAIPVHPE